MRFHLNKLGVYLCYAGDILCPDQCIMCNMQRHIVISFTTTSRTLKPFAILDRLQGLYEMRLVLIE